VAGRRAIRIAIIAAAVAVTAAAAIVVNFTLLGYAQPRNDPVGRLSPRATLQPATAPAPTVPPATVTVGEADD
jgi:hypothetical protein